MNRRRHVTHLQALSVAARRSGFWRVGDRCLALTGQIGRIENFRAVGLERISDSQFMEHLLTVQKIRDIVAEMRQRPQAPTVVVDGVLHYVIPPS